MSSVLRPRSHSLPSDFARFVVERFGYGPFLVVGRESDELERQFRAVKATATVFASVSDLPAASSQNGVATRSGMAIWFYPHDNAGNEPAAQALAAAAENVLLVPEPGGQNGGRRAELVRHFAKAGLLPD
ncbi:MAG: hypothetical protein QOF80_2449, partial [Verrucomicrobiota bacterium]